MLSMIEIQVLPMYPAVDVSELRHAIERVFHETRCQKELTVCITDDATVQRLNHQFRGIDSVTDVLSFPSDDTDYLGDIAIAYPYASSQALQVDSTVMTMLQLLAVHGTLHLLGYTHDTKENQMTMWAIQQRVLRQLDIPVSIVHKLVGKEHCIL